jgi:hypothetical protein
MSAEIKVPAVGESISSGIISIWHAFMIALCQWAATILLGAGWIWAIFNAWKIYQNSQ